MKKSILALLLVAAVVTVAVISCKKEDSDFDKGKKDGKAFCDCMKAAKTDLEAAACLGKLDLGKLGEEDMDAEEPKTEYGKGVAESMKNCDID